MADTADPLGALRLLGDGRSVALLTPTAEISWWCTPRVDAPPTFWSLLDAHGAAARFDNVEALGTSPHPAGASLWTRLATECGTVEVHDGMIAGALVRVIRALDDELRLCHRVSFGGFGEPTARTWTATLLTAARGETIALRIEPGVVDLVPASDVSLEPEAQAVESSGKHADRVRDAFRVMTALRYQPTGAVAAAATTSLPEVLGGERQFDYRYAWLRDGSLAASVAALYGRLDLASDFLGFVERLGDQVFTAPLFTVDGGAVPTERCVEHVRGYSGATPIRVGNEAATQVQFDALASSSKPSQPSPPKVAACIGASGAS